jgi:hypothetical protein
MQIEIDRDARQAALAGTRQMMHEDEFEALASVLIGSGAVSKAVMCEALEALIQRLIAKARGQLATEFALYPAEIFERVREIHYLAERLK